MSNKGISIEPCRKLLNDKYDAPYDIALLTLYGDLASRGELSEAAGRYQQGGVPYFFRGVQLFWSDRSGSHGLEVSTCPWR